MNTPVRHDEVGPELVVDELTPGKIVAVRPPGEFRSYRTIQVVVVGPRLVIFYVGQTDRLIACHRRPDGSLRDGRDRVVRVFQYLGDTPQPPDPPARGQPI